MDVENINIIMRQTNYDYETAEKMLATFDNNHIKVIEDYLGIKQKSQPIKSINKEMYKQFRLNLDKSMRDYTNKNPINIETVKL
jgi:hypothetical protein